MNWTSNKSLMLSRICVAVFAVLLLALDIGCYRVVRWFFVEIRGTSPIHAAGLMVSVYCGSIFAWICLNQLWRLLGNLRGGAVFTRENVICMRCISWCCMCAAAICLVSAVYYLPFVFVAIAAGFMGLIVRIVKNAFQQAIVMKDELDLTI